MTKGEILDRINELEVEAQELRAEQEAINHVLSFVVSRDSSRCDEIFHETQRRQEALHVRVAKWEAKIRAIDAEVSRLGFAAA